jgi:hypothetical protein
MEHTLSHAWKDRGKSPGIYRTSVEQEVNDIETDAQVTHDMDMDAR